jgi:dUTP pyrophosphatase
MTESSPVSLKVRRVGPLQVPLPRYQTPGSAGLDLCAALAAPVRLEPGERRLIPVGIAVELPSGYEGQVRPRSGLALKYGIGIVNAPGTIDADFRGELGVVLINFGRESFVVEPFARIAQLVISPVQQVNVVEVESLSATARGAGGYGSTGEGA